MIGKFLTSEPALLPLPGFKRYMLQDVVVFKRCNGEIITVPVGFETDLTTCYREGPWTMAALVHDYLLDKTDRTRAECDSIFREALLACGCSTERSWYMWCGVRLGAAAAKLKEIFKWRTR